MRRFRLTPLGSMITTVSLAIGVATVITVYVWVVLIGGASGIAHQIAIGGLIAVALALAVGFYFAQLVGSRVKRIEEGARKIAEGDFASPIPVESSGQLGQLARTFNEMQRRLAELDNARKQFIANASHELRTPVFSLGGFIELIEEEDPSPEERAEFVRTMRQQVERLTKLTTDLLDLSQLDAGGIVMAIEAVDLTSVAREVLREFGPRADRRGSRLELRTSPGPVVASADPDRVRQIVRILLDNALTHTPEGTSVAVTAYAANRQAQLIVSDEGPGVPARAHKRIFDRFFTADSAGGSGLGLAIAWELAQRMDGSISITSNKRFTAFRLDLPPAGRVSGLPASTEATEAHA